MTSPFSIFEIPESAFNSMRQLTLEAAAECILKNRLDIHGLPEDNFRDIATGWSVIVGKEISPTDVCLMMGWLKTVRAKNNPCHMDNYTDLAGYAACAAECADSQLEQSP